MDPFYESQENHNLIGVANVFLDFLFHDVKLDYQVPIISQQGEVKLFMFIKFYFLFLISKRKSNIKVCFSKII